MSTSSDLATVLHAVWVNAPTGADAWAAIAAEARRLLAPTTEAGIGALLEQAQGRLDRASANVKSYAEMLTRCETHEHDALGLLSDAVARKQGARADIEALERVLDMVKLAIREPGCSQRERQGEPMNDKNDKTRPMLEFATMRAQALEASRSDLEMLEAAGFRVWAAFERRVDELGREYMHAIGWRVTSGNRPAGYDAADFYALAVACASNLARERQRQSDRRAQEGLGA